MKEFSTTCTSYTIQVAQPNNLEEIMQIMRENFYYEEVMFQALLSNTATINDNDRRLINNNFDDTIKVAFHKSPCLVAIHKESGKIVAVNLMTISKNPKFGDGSDGLSKIFTSEKPKSQLVQQYFYYLSDINDKADLFAKYPNVKAMLEFYAIAVDKKHRRIRLAEDLLTAGILLAQEIADVSLVFGVFTSKYSTRSAEKAGMNNILEFDLLDYKSYGTIFAKTIPHNIVALMCLQV